MAEAKGNFLSGIPWFVQFLGIVLIGILLGYMIGNLAFSDTRAETASKKEELGVLREDNRKGAIVRDNLKSYQKRYDQAQSELDALRELLPQEVEISKILENIQEQVAEQKLVLKVFKPNDFIKKDFYKEKPINIQVTGTYNSLGNFFQQLATYRRIVNVTDVDVKKALQQQVNYDIDASFTVTAFLASDQDVINATTPATSTSTDPNANKGGAK